MPAGAHARQLGRGLRQVREDRIRHLARARMIAAALHHLPQRAHFFLPDLRKLQRLRRQYLRLKMGAGKLRLIFPQGAIRCRPRRLGIGSALTRTSAAFRQRLPRLIWIDSHDGCHPRFTLAIYPSADG